MSTISLHYIGQKNVKPSSQIGRAHISFRAQAPLAARQHVEAWDIQPLSPGLEKALRMLSSQFMQYKFDNKCHASHEQLAKAFGCVKSTMQCKLTDLRALGLIHVEHRHGTSDITTLADGVKEALEIQKLERARAKLMVQTTPSADRDLRDDNESVKILQNHDPLMLTSPPVNNRPKALPNKQTSFPTMDTKGKSQTMRACVSKEGKPPGLIVSSPSLPLPLPEKKNKNVDEALVQKLEEAGVARHQAVLVVRELPAERITKHIEHGAYRTAQNPAGFLVSAIRGNWETREKNTTKNQPEAFSSASKTEDIPGENSAIVSKLVEIGVAPSIAAMTAKIWDSGHIRTQIDLHEHEKKQNPAGYLIEAIRCDFAAKRAKPGSEHAAVLARENKHQRQREPKNTNINRAMPRIDLSTPLDELRRKFDQLPDDLRAQWEANALEKIKKSPPQYAIDVIKRNGLKSPIVQAMILAKTMELWQESQRAGFGCAKNDRKRQYANTQ